MRIDFTILCFFFVSLHFRALKMFGFYNFNIFSSTQVNVLGILGGKNENVHFLNFQLEITNILLLKFLSKTTF